MYAINKKCLHTIEKCFIICLVLGLGVYDLPKSIDGLMRYMRVKKHISISGSAQKRKLLNMGYYHGYKGYRFIGKSSNSILYTDFKELVAIYDFDMRLKSLLYPQLMFIETALKNYVLEEILKESNSDNFNYIYTKLLTDYTRFTPGSDKQKNAIKQRLAVRDRVYSALTREYGNKKEVVQHFYHKDTSVPIWAIFEVLTLGEFGNFYSCLSYGVRREVSIKLGFHQPSDSDAFLTKKIIFAIKELRNAVAHNDVIFDTRFSRSSIDKSLSSSLEIVTGIKSITFKSITDYIILVVYLLKCFGVPKGDMRRFVAEFQDNIETLRKQIPTSLFARIVLTDTRPKLKSLQEYIRK